VAIIVFKDLQKLVSHSQQDKKRKELFERLKDKPFWIWDIAEHKKEDVKTYGDCCFNHISGLSQKDGNDKLLYDYLAVELDKEECDDEGIEVGIRVKPEWGSSHE
jgi:hypothetical protein